MFCTLSKLPYLILLLFGMGDEVGSIILILPLSDCMYDPGKIITSPSFSFLSCEMGSIMVLIFRVILKIE